ncbi:MAG TPA: beta-1,3-glucanase family protein [Actinocrinis sp.]|nr:beta-1,3-glucanase family protein [Actinocrinis sp.]
MLSRRKFIAASTAVAGGVAVAGGLVSASRASATASTLNLALQNTSTSNTVYAYITGQALNNNNALVLIEADGHTPYYPASPSSPGQPLAVNCAIKLGAPGTTTNVTIPQIAGGRVWFSIGSPLTFLINPGPGLVEPTVANPNDPNINIMWDFCEFTFNASQLYANITYVDFVSIPISLTLTNSSGQTQHVSGIPANGLATVCNGLIAQNNADGAGWNKLITTSGGQNLRALSPNSGIAQNSSLFSGYFQPYINQVWSKYAGTSLSVDTQASWGTVSGRVSGSTLSFPGVVSYGQPAAADIFSCNSGPFANTAGEVGAISARICAAFNRSTLLIDTSQPDGESSANYYKNTITNHYARIVHAANLDGRGYAFPYDDVAPSGGGDQSGDVNDPNPVLLTIAVGGGTATTGGGSGPTATATAAPTGGSGGGFNPYSTIQAESYTSQSGTQNETTTDTGGGQDVGYIGNGDWLAYANVNFGNPGATNFSARVASGATSGVSGLVQVCLDSPTATPIGSFALGSTGGWQTWKTVPANISTVTGTHTVYLTFASGQPADFVNINWFTFSH